MVTTHVFLDRREHGRHHGLGCARSVEVLEQRSTPEFVGSQQHGCRLESTSCLPGAMLRLPRFLWGRRSFAPAVVTAVVTAVTTVYFRSGVVVVVFVVVVFIRFCTEGYRKQKTTQQSLSGATTRKKVRCSHGVPKTKIPTFGPFQHCYFGHVLRGSVSYLEQNESSVQKRKYRHFGDFNIVS